MNNAPGPNVRTAELLRIAAQWAGTAAVARNSATSVASLYVR